ncbi:MAG: FlgD immunoglobulin-like domain containing protein [Victivallales bacterium]
MHRILIWGFLIMAIQLKLAAICLGAEIDTSDGKAIMVPAPGKVVIDGDLEDWDLSGQEQVSLDVSNPDALGADYALMYDAQNLYLAVRVKDPTPLKNIYEPLDGRYWEGDCLQFRLAADPSLPKPLPDEGKGLSQEQLARVFHIGLWHHHPSGKDRLHLDAGMPDGKNAKLDLPGAELATKVCPDGKGYTVECALPWTILGMEKAPAAGSELSALLEILWSDSSGGKSSIRVSAIRKVSPGGWGFTQWSKWGRISVSATGNLQRPDHLTVDRIRSQQSGSGVPITLALKNPGAVSINILDSKGQVIKELIKETLQPAGEFTLRWNGLDYSGHAVAPGTYNWKAISYTPLSARYIGGVGSSGEPPYDTPDGKGAWGSDHVDPWGVASDATGFYFLWNMAEQGKSVVKVDRNGKTLWRKSPVTRNHWGDFTSLAGDGKYLYLLAGLSDEPEIFRLDAATGNNVPYGNSWTAAAVGGKKKPKTGKEPNAPGLAIRDAKGYVSLYYEDRIAVMDLKSGKVEGELKLVKPFGLCFDSKGDLYAISRGNEGNTANVVRFAAAAGDPIPVIDKELLSPVYLAVLDDGQIAVTDAAPASQQVKRFSADGKLLEAKGKAGGRPWAGKYEPENFLRPWGISSDGEGGLLVAENSPPRVITWFNKDGGIRKRWFGPGTYGTSVWADPADPFTLYYAGSGGNQGGTAMMRATIDPKTGEWSGPQAYWDWKNAGYPSAYHGHTTIFNVPNIVIVDGHRFQSSDFSKFTIMRLDGNVIIPVAYLGAGQDGRPAMILEKPRTAEPDKAAEKTAVKGAIPSSLYGFGVDDRLNVYFQAGRKIICIPCAGLDKDGLPSWDNDRQRVVVEDYCPGINDADLANQWRRQGRGLRVDAEGNLYFAWCAGPESSGPFWSAHLTLARLHKYNSAGQLLWAVGQKAMAPRKDGEIYNIFLFAGLANQYAALGDEAGKIHFYTPDGLYRGNIFNDLAAGPLPGPETFTCETFSGRVVYDPKTKKYYAYQGQTAGLMFEVSGLGAEETYAGSVMLTAEQIAGIGRGEKDVPGAISQVPEDFVLDGSDARWNSLFPFTLRQGERKLASIFASYNSKMLFGRWDVLSKIPFTNGADEPEIGFKGGNCVGLYLGLPGQRATPILGDVRLMVVPQGKDLPPAVIGMKPKTGGGKSPRTYQSPVGTAEFEWVGVVPGAQALVKPFEGGYRVEIAVPREFMENLTLKPGGHVRFDAEVLLSDESGKKTLTRNFLFSQGAETSMVADVPTEARLYPAKWKKLNLRQNPMKRADANQDISHADMGELFDESSCLILEAEQAFSRPPKFRIAKQDVGMLLASPPFDAAAPLYVGWRLPETVKPGKYNLWLCWWLRVSDAKLSCKVELGTDREHVREAAQSAVLLHPNSAKPETMFGWQKCVEIEVKKGDRYLLLTPNFKSDAYTDFRLDAIALVPQDGN